MTTGNARQTVQCASSIFVHYDTEGGGDGVEDGDGGGDEHKEGNVDGEKSTSRRSQPKIEEGRQEEKTGIPRQFIGATMPHATIGVYNS
jgi:hypothetical protein